MRDYKEYNIRLMLKTKLNLLIIELDLYNIKDTILICAINTTSSKDFLDYLNFNIDKEKQKDVYIKELSTVKKDLLKIVKLYHLEIKDYLKTI